MKTKICFKCNKEKKLTEFYKHKGMADGHLNKCKDCTKKDFKKRYYDSVFRKKIIDYEKKRFKNQRRKEKIKQYQKKSRIVNKEKYIARNAVNNALRDGRLIKKPCQVCGNKKSQAHHKDYSKPLDIVWLCRKHHLEEEGKTPF